jgi:hypothetical protein
MATNQPVKIQPRPNVKQIGYLSKTFTDFRQNFIEFTKAYYPNTYSDFNEASPGMMFIEMASYLGDVLSFYIDNSFKENLMAYAEQTPNIVTIAQFLGYKPKLISVATTEAELSIIVPAKLENGEYVPDSKYLVKVGLGSTFSTNEANSVSFRLVEPVDFSDITTQDYVINSFDISGNPDDFVVVKKCKLVAGTEKTVDFSFTSAQRFTTKQIEDDNVVGILGVVDSSNNKWYEVDYLAQDVIMDDLELADNNESGIMPSAGLRLRKAPRRFITRINRDLKTELIFGSGVTNDSDEDVLVDSRQIATNQYGSTIVNSVANIAVNNFNFLNSTAYGLAPSNTTLTVTYLVGGGVESNCNANTIVNVDNLVVQNDTTAYSPAETVAFNATLQTVEINNPLPATGGGQGDSIEEIRENALMFFNAQNRVVTMEDYVVRSYALPPKYGTVAKAYAIRDEQLNAVLTLQDNQFVENAVNPTAVNLYTLGYNKNKKLATLNTSVKENLARYIEQYRLLTDDVNILDAFVINIGVRFDITVFRNYNMKDVLARSIDTIQQFFDVDKWVINQPIIIADLIYQIGSVEGVQNVGSVEIFNKYQFKDGLDYHPYRYNIADATMNGVVYPSLDPSIFELRYPQNDIIGNATQ